MVGRSTVYRFSVFQFSWDEVVLGEFVCGGLDGGDDSGFGCRGWLMFDLRGALGGGRRVAFHDFLDELADHARAFFSLGDFGARREDA